MMNRASLSSPWFTPNCAIQCIAFAGTSPIHKQTQEAQIGFSYFGATSNETTFSAPRSMSISTKRCPTNPLPPVTTCLFEMGAASLLSGMIAALRSAPSRSAGRAPGPKSGLSLSQIHSTLRVLSYPGTLK